MPEQCLDKYLGQLQVVVASTGLKHVVEVNPEKAVLKETKGKIACLWLIHEPAPRIGCSYEKDGFCTNLKYCNQKGEWFR